jgi:hypothetical protein
MHVPIVPIQKRCEPSCCTRKQIPLQVAWAKTIHSVQGNNAGPTAANQTPNAIQRISVHIGDRKYEAFSPGLTCVAISRATTIRRLGHMATLPITCMISAIYFLGGTFPSGIKCLKHTYFNKEEYNKFKKHAVWISHLDKYKKKTKHVSDSSVRNGIKKWLGNRKYTCQELLSIIRDKSWREKYIDTTIPNKKSPTYKTTEKNLLSPIPPTLTSLLQPNILMEGNCVEDFLSLLISANPNMSFMATHFGPHIGQYGETYWDEKIATQRSNSPQRAVALLQKEKHIIFIPWFTGHTREGHWSMVVQQLYKNNNVCFYHFNSLNRFTNIVPYSLSNTPLYTPQTYSWQNVQTIRQTELECGMRACMDASLITQNTANFQSRVKKCKDIFKLSKFSRQCVVNHSVLLFIGKHEAHINPIFWPVP